MSSLSGFKFFQSLSRFIFQLTSLSTLLEFMYWYPTSQLRILCELTANVLLFGLLWVDSFAATRIAVAVASEGGHGVRSGE